MVNTRKGFKLTPTDKDKRIAELEKENAELNNFIMQSKKDGISPINALIIKNLGNQLIEAIEIIKGLLGFVDSLGNYSGGIFAKAEQFLKDSEVEK